MCHSYFIGDMSLGKSDNNNLAQNCLFMYIVYIEEISINFTSTDV